MAELRLEDAIDVAAHEIAVEVARTPEQVRDALHLRYKVYCQECGFESGSDGMEQDAFDAHSHHVLVRNIASGGVFGTARIVLAADGTGHDSFPMQRVCEHYVLAPLPPFATGEISRFAVTRDRVGLSPAAAAMVRLFIMRGIVEISGHCGLTHWCALMEPSLLRLLRATGVYFELVGPMVEHHGRRQSAVAATGSLLDRMRREQPRVWSFITGDGTLWPRSGYSSRKFVLRSDSND